MVAGGALGRGRGLPHPTSVRRSNGPARKPCYKLGELEERLLMAEEEQTLDDEPDTERA